MTLLPIVERELRLATNRPRTYGARMVASGITAVVGIVLLANLNSWTTAAGAGQAVFQLISETSFWLCLFAGVFTTSICVSEEKREGTLGLLFLTDLRGYDVVLGKLVTVSLNAVQMLMGVFPALALTLILGGVSGQEFWRTALVLSNTLFFSLAIGLFVSSISRRPAKAMGGTLVLIVLAAAGPWAADYLLFRDFRLFGTDYVLPGPFQAYALVWDDRYKLPPHAFWGSVLFCGWFTGGWLALASHLLPRTCQESPHHRSVSVWNEFWSRRLLRRILHNPKLRAYWLRRNPIYWLAIRRRSAWFYIWGLICLVLAAWLSTLAYFGFAGQRFSFLVFMCLTPALHAVVKVAIAAEAASRLNEGRRNGELELLLATPVSTRAIARGQIRALSRQFAMPVALVIAIDLALILFGGASIHESDEQTLFRFLSVWGMLIMLLIDVRALAWVGLWEGLRCKNAFAALKRTLLRILVVPWPFFFATLPFSPTVLFGTVMDADGGWYLGAIIWWWFVGFLVNFVFCLAAERGLKEQFRVVASEYFVPKSRGHRLVRRKRLVLPDRLVPQRRST